MMDARILIVEDDAIWIRLMTKLLGSIASVVDAAQTLADAQYCLEQRYYNVVIVDLNMRDEDPKNSDGLEFLALLQRLQLAHTVRPIVLSAYGDMDLVRQVFHDYKVADFLKKMPLTQSGVLKEAVMRALDENHLNRPLTITVAGEEQLKTLWGHLHWTQREDPMQLEPEFYDLLRRLFPKARQLFIRKLPAGQSGAGVLEVEPGYAFAVGEPIVLKFGKRDKILQEYHNYTQYVEPYISNLCSTQLGCETGRVLGAITYRLLGAEPGAVTSFANFYARSSVDAILAATDSLFRKTCARWYDNHWPLRERRDLVALYSCSFNLVWDEVWANIKTLGFDPDAETLQFPDLPGTFLNPKRWLEKRHFQLYLPAWCALTHGDLNVHNVLVTAHGDCWLIDFYRSGVGHILRDLVVLETSMKFELTAYTDLAQFYEAETHLLHQQSMDKPLPPAADHPQQKLLTVLGHLREVADMFTGATNSMHEYNASLLLTTLNLLRLGFLRQAHPAALLSAAMICGWLEGEGV